MGGPQRLAERAGSGRARELVMTADLYDAPTLREWGVVNYVHEDVDAQSRALVERIANGPTVPTPRPRRSSPPGGRAV